MSTSRRFLIASSLARLIQREKGSLRVTEGYFPPQQDRSSYVLLMEHRGFLVLKTNGSAGPAEERVEVPQSHADALLDVAAGGVDYGRSTLSVGSHEIHIDQFQTPGTLQLITVELEHDRLAREFTPLPWFGPEVTSDQRYTNQLIALHGLPEAIEVPLSDAALHSLLDTIENRFPAGRIRRPATGPTPDVPAEPRAPAASGGHGGAVAQGVKSSVEEELIRELALTLQSQRRR